MSQIYIAIIGYKFKGFFQGIVMAADHSAGSHPAAAGLGPGTTGDPRNYSIWAVRFGDLTARASRRQVRRADATRILCDKSVNVPGHAPQEIPVGIITLVLHADNTLFIDH